MMRIWTRIFLATTKQSKSRVSKRFECGSETEDVCRAQVPADGARVFVAACADGEGHPRRNRLGVPALHLLEAAAGKSRPTEVRICFLGPCFDGFTRCAFARFHSLSTAA